MIEIALLDGSASGGARPERFDGPHCAQGE